MKSPTIPEVEPQFEKEIDPFQQPFQQQFQQPFQQPFQQQVISCDTPTMSARRRSSIFEETLTSDLSMCRWLLDIISENDHLVKESEHFVLSENQLIRVVASTFDTPESQIQLSIEDEAYSGRFCNNLTQTLNEILIGNVNVLKLDVEKIQDDALLLLKVDKLELIDAYNRTEAEALFDDKLNISDKIDAYSKTEDDALLFLKADKSELIDAYSKKEDDELLALKLNISNQIDAYNKTEADALLDDKQNISDQIDELSKTENDALMLLNANKTELDNYDDLSSTQTIIGQKQFGIINVSNISKYNKNDASILLAGGGDMLVSSLLSQPQLQEVRDIASGKSKGYVFATTQEMNTQLNDQENWDGTGRRELDTELSDMNNVITILGTATGGGNAIIDLSIEGNTLTHAKNTSFITTGNDQSIIGKKTFTCIIISNGIQYSRYNNNSVFLADGGIKARQNINASVDLSNYYSKSQTYSQTETNNMLNNKLNISDQIEVYTKGEDDAKSLKVDKTQLIDTYTK
ncbi:MAG: hypothetical protein EZS28_037153 [Streblomastix strix]|uniref:Uncharacterized protein n=1 Tax=Streblomastix strix TaxID=222440 RepID=A0A5J4UAU2_9EUKA|nr:MAG: hypothetical protein EZS28_037153 [Streblomastix strix]